jgi:hypothetical protein
MFTNKESIKRFNILSIVRKVEWIRHCLIEEYHFNIYQVDLIRNLKIHSQLGSSFITDPNNLFLSKECHYANFH